MNQSNNKDITDKWPFIDVTNTAVFTTKRVLHENYPILYVCHDKDGDWQFLCGTTNAKEQCSMVSLNRIYQKDHSVGQLAMLPCGWKAWRESSEQPWVIEKPITLLDRINIKTLLDVVFFLMLIFIIVFILIKSLLPFV